MTLSSLAIAVISLPYSTTLCHLSFIAFLINWIAEGKWAEKWDVARQNPLAWLYTVYFFLHVVGMLYTDNVSHGWAVLDKKIFLFLIPLAIVTSHSLNPGQIRSIYLIFIGTCLAATFYCLWYSFDLAASQAIPQNFGLEASENLRVLNPTASKSWLYFSYVSLGAGIQLHPTYFSLYLLSCILVLVDLFFRGEYHNSNTKATLALIVAGYFSVFIFLLNARIVILPTAVLLAMCIFYSLRYRISTAVSFTGLFTLVACLGLFFTNPVSRFRNLQEPFLTDFKTRNEMAKSSISIRTSLWWLSFQAAKETNPLLGLGTGDANDRLKDLSERFNKKNILNTYDPHNQFIQSYLALGLPGLVSLLACLFFPFYIATRNGSFLVASIHVLLLLVCCSESILEVQKGIAFIALFASLAISTTRPGVSVQSKLRYA